MQYSNDILVFFTRLATLHFNLQWIGWVTLVFSGLKIFRYWMVCVKKKLAQLYIIVNKQT